MNVLQLRTELETLLASVLGTYTLANGAEVPAVSVRSIGEGLATGTLVEGIELIIIRDPELSPVNQYMNQSASRSWILYLVDWDDTAELETVAAYIVHAYGGSTVESIPVGRGQGPQHQLRITIQADAGPTDDYPPYQPVTQIPGPPGPEGPQGPAGPIVGLGDLTDVDTTAKVSKSILYYDAVSGEWKGDSAQTILTVTDYGNF
jgi:hypothetical protein